MDADGANNIVTGGAAVVVSAIALMLIKWLIKVESRKTDKTLDRVVALEASNDKVLAKLEHIQELLEKFNEERNGGKS